MGWRGLIAGLSLLALAAGCDGGGGQSAAPEPAEPAAWGISEQSEGLEAESELAEGGREEETAPGDFDYFLLALSWSPSFCAAPGMAEREAMQCGGRPYAFVVHGLWPQHERGWPESCPSTQARDADDGTVEAMLDLMPSPSLIQHQWDKHGVCTGQSPDAYFDDVRAFRERVRIPRAFERLEAAQQVTAADVEQAFIDANRGLTPEAVVVTCSRDRLREVRICMTKSGEFRACGADVTERCGDRALTMLPVRGG